MHGVVGGSGRPVAPAVKRRARGRGKRRRPRGTAKLQAWTLLAGAALLAISVFTGINRGAGKLAKADLDRKSVV